MVANGIKIELFKGVSFFLNLSTEKKSALLFRFHMFCIYLVKLPLIFHPSVFCCLSGFGLRGQQSEQRVPDFPHPRHLLQLIEGETKTFPNKPRNIISPTNPGSALGPPPSARIFPGYLTYETSRRHPSQIGPAAALLQVPQPISKRDSRDSLKETYFCHLQSQPHSFGLHPELMTIGEDRDIYSPLN